MERRTSPSEVMLATSQGKSGPRIRAREHHQIEMGLGAVRIAASLAAQDGRRKDDASRHEWLPARGELVQGLACDSVGTRSIAAAERGGHVLSACSRPAGDGEFHLP
ncbi:hypothetical protein [Arthrobacter woluwensis]|uniref:hypothetical protein n=1 Tax=Arthrobacter woluwensis TaxID=156980 RepID=UPI001FBB2418|nr:hypothetical protein [Arthrobacter woluwensis]